MANKISQNADQNVLVWDFDGVVNDSFIPRAVVTSLLYETYKRNSYKIPEMSESRLSLDYELNRLVVDTLRPPRPFLIPEQGGRRNFLEQLILILDKGEQIRSVGEFRALQAKYPEVAKIGESYIDLFRQIDSAMEEQYPSIWGELNLLYDGAKEKFLSLNKEFIAYILSGKDNEAVAKVLRYHNISFNENCILFGGGGLTKEGKTPKIAELEHIHERTSKPYPQMHYIDDEIEQITEIKKSLPALNVYWASWGYVPQRFDSGILKNQGIEVTSLDNFDVTIRKNISL